MESARRFGVEDLVILHGFVSRSEILAATKAATAAVVVTSVNSASSIWDNGVVTGKLFEPLGLKTPICLISPRGSDARKIVEEADAGSCFTGDQVEQIAEYIISLCEGRQPPTFKNCSIYSWPELAKRLDEVLTKSLGA
jgi:glycosyltransferase involved in cell wall biosynthesis